MPRSIRVRSEYIHTIKSALLRNGFPSQKILAEDLGIAQSTVSNFLNGKPVDYANFLEICVALAQDWRNIADFADKIPQEESTDLKFKVFLSHLSPNFTFTEKLQQGLTTAGHEVLIADKNTPLQSDYFLLLLSEQFAVSEILLEQVQLAKELHQTPPQKPVIFPICLDLPWQNALPFDLLQLLLGIQPWQWHSCNEPAIIVSEILNLFTQNRTSLPAEHELAINWHTISSYNPYTEAEKNQIPNPHPLPVAAPEIPQGQVELTSHFYIERLPIEPRCYEAITQPGALIRIKAPRQMGKTSLMARILHHAENHESKTVSLSFQLANKKVFSNSDTFLQWFCASIGLEIGQLDALAKCWELAEIIGSNQCCKAYFEECLLSPSSPPLTLGLDEVDRVFEFPEIADDFFGLLRALHEEAKRRNIWKKFRLVVVHSTEVYIPLDVNKSPFNVGLPIELPEFNAQQVQELAKRHGLNWHQEEVEKLMNLVGGHPYLVRLAMYHIARQDVTLDQVVEAGATETGIYSDHLRRHLWNLEKYPELLAAMKEVVLAENGVRLRSQLAFKLNSMGLVKLSGNESTSRSYLYHQYFWEALR